MGNFRSNKRSGFGNRGGGFRDNRGGNRGFSRGGGFARGRDSDRPQMHEATCSNCGKICQVPFKPTGSKPVFCNDCFRQQSNSNRFDSGNRDEQSQTSQGGISTEQFNKINAKLDKIIGILQNLELDVEEDEEDMDLDDEDLEEFEDEEDEDLDAEDDEDLEEDK